MPGSTLGRAAGDLLTYVNQFRLGASAGLPAELRNQLLGLLDGFARHPAAQGADPIELEDARFALVAWIDETLLRSGWSGREDWRLEPLQLQIFRTNRAGDEFYERLARLRPEQTAAREIYFLCLAFGFEGQYAGREADRRALMNQQFEMLRVANHAADVASLAPLTPAAYEFEIVLPDARRKPLWPALLSMLGAALAAFGVLWIALYLYAGQVPVPPT